jgi:hypothetical protein
MTEEIRVFRLHGSQSLAQAVDEVDQCLRDALAAGDRRVLVDVRGLTGFAKPDLPARMAMVRRWAETAAGRVKLAVVSPVELNDGERFDVVIAQSLAFDGDVFEDESDARRWLEQSPALWRGPPPAF